MFLHVVLREREETALFGVETGKEGEPKFSKCSRYIEYTPYTVYPDSAGEKQNLIMPPIHFPPSPCVGKEEEGRAFATVCAVKERDAGCILLSRPRSLTPSL